MAQADIGGPTIISRASTAIFFDEFNQATPETLNSLYEITHRKVSHQKLYRYIPYKYGKHAMKGGQIIWNNMKIS